MSKEATYSTTVDIKALIAMKLKLSTTVYSCLTEMILVQFAVCLSSARGAESVKPLSTFLA